VSVRDDIDPAESAGGMADVAVPGVDIDELLAADDRRARQQAFLRFGAPLIGVVGFLLVWQILVAVFDVPRFVLPAPWDILKHIAGQHITVHCTITRQQALRDGYLEEFARVWSANPNVSQLWFSLYTPQIGEVSPEILLPHDRQRVIAALMSMRKTYRKIAMPESLVQQYGTPPDGPGDCIFAQTTSCISADFEHRITPCQFGGNPDCSQCGCIASAGLKAVGAHKIIGGTVRIGAIFETSLKIGRSLRNRREAVA